MLELRERRAKGQISGLSVADIARREPGDLLIDKHIKQGGTRSGQRTRSGSCDSPVDTGIEETFSNKGIIRGRRSMTSQAKYTLRILHHPSQRRRIKREQEAQPPGQLADLIRFGGAESRQGGLELLVDAGNGLRVDGEGTSVPVVGISVAFVVGDNVGLGR